MTSLKVRRIASRCGSSERFNTTICSAIVGFGSTGTPRGFTAVEMEAQQVSGACQVSFVFGYSPGLRASFMGGCCSLGYEASSSSIQADRSLPQRASRIDRRGVASVGQCRAPEKQIQSALEADRLIGRAVDVQIKTQLRGRCQATSATMPRPHGQHSNRRQRSAPSRSSDGKSSPESRSYRALQADVC